MKITVIGYCDADASQNSIRIAQSWTIQRHSVQMISFNEFTAQPGDTIAQILKHRPEFCLVTMGRSFDHTFLQSLKDAGIFLAQWIPDEYGPDDGRSGKWLAGIRGIYDLLMVETRGIVPLLKGYATDVIWISQFFDHRYHKCIERRGQYAFDVGFLGGPNPEQSSIRLKFLSKLMSDGYDVQVGGGDFFWGHYRNMIPSMQYFSDGILIGGEMAKFYSRARISLNFVNDLLPQYELGMSNRVFKTIGSGSCLITPALLGLDKVLTAGKHCVTYSPMDYHDLIEKVAFFLKHPRQREEIAAQGKQYVLENYNIDKITAGFIDEVKKRL